MAHSYQVSKYSRHIGGELPPARGSLRLTYSDAFVDEAPDHQVVRELGSTDHTLVPTPSAQQ